MLLLLDLLRTEAIETALRDAGWEFDTEVLIGPGRVSLAGQSMYEESQELRGGYILRMGRMPLAVLEAKAGHIDTVDHQAHGRIHRVDKLAALTDTANLKEASTRRTR